jgi:NADPH:quinone reductase-like Zn-dependent oxidoreductase
MKDFRIYDSQDVYLSLVYVAFEDLSRGKLPRRNFMKAARIHEYGGPEKVVIDEIENPTVGNGQVVVKVRAASLNPFDTTVREGRVPGMVTLPVILGGDIAGEVVEVGTAVTDFKVGDEVYGQAAAVAGNSGALAEFAVTKAGQIALKPKSVDMMAAACLPLVGVSAMQALQKHINLQPGQTILIQGGAGAIGSVAVQLAKYLGAKVYATATENGIRFAQEMGADGVINYQKEKFEERVKDVDAVFDTVGGEILERSYAVAKRGGTIVTMIGKPDGQKAQELGITVIAQQTRVSTDKLQGLAKLVDEGVIKPHIAKVFDLDQAAEAFKTREAGHLSGKVVLKI